MPDTEAMNRDVAVVVCKSSQVASVKRLWLGSGYEEITGLPEDVFALARVFKGVNNADPKVDEYDQRVLMFATKAEDAAADDPDAEGQD
ncbi:hypothetical protein [Brevundimonas sp.]|uniref:hypothetical protein n=1 Tax=Brevundimonas sp. TaxID=1871086 RepID=UPI002EDB09E8